MLNLMKVLILFASLFLFSSVNAAGVGSVTIYNVVCINPATAEEVFKKKYNKQVFLTGILTSRTSILQLFADPLTNKWSIVVVDLDRNRSCLLFHGIDLSPRYPNRKEQHAKIN